MSLLLIACCAVAAIVLLPLLPLLVELFARCIPFLIALWIFFTYCR